MTQNSFLKHLKTCTSKSRTVYENGLFWPIAKAMAQNIHVLKARQKHRLPKVEQFLKKLIFGMSPSLHDILFLQGPKLSYKSPESLRFQTQIPEPSIYWPIWHLLANSFCMGRGKSIQLRNALSPTMGPHHGEDANLGRSFAMKRSNFIEPTFKKNTIAICHMDPGVAQSPGKATRFISGLAPARDWETTGQRTILFVNRREKSCSTHSLMLVSLKQAKNRR